MAQSGKPVIEVNSYFIHAKRSIYMVVSKICLETGEIVAIKKFKDSEDNDDVKRTTMRKELNICPIRGPIRGTLLQPTTVCERSF